MSISQNKYKYLYISLFLLIGVFIYEQFSHGVTSNLMRLSIFIPFLGGFLLPRILPNTLEPNSFEKTTWYMSLSSLTIGLFVYGVFEIYGSIEQLVYIYFYFSVLLGIIAIISYLYRLTKKEKAL